MPTYDYECQECKHRFEMFHSMKEDPVKKCAKCGGKVKKLIGAGAGIIFKGSGFYVNDYKKSNSNSGESKQKNNKSKSTTTSTETKPDTASSTSTPAE